MTLELLEQLRRHARDRKHRAAICEAGARDRPPRCVTFAELLDRVRLFAAQIEKVVSPGDVVIVCLPNRIECTAAFLGVLEARSVGFLVNPGLTSRELRRAAVAASARAIIGAPQARAALADLGLVAVPSDGSLDDKTCLRTRSDAPAGSHQDAGLMLLSSGTTAEPKIVLRHGAALDAVARNVTNAVGLTGDDRVLMVIPLCHSYGVEHGILAPTYAGCGVTLCEGFDARLVHDQLSGDGGTILPGVPSMFELLADRGDGGVTFPRVRCAYSAGGPLPMSVFEACRARLRLRVGQLYGSSEVGSVTFNDPNAPGHDPMSVGFCMDGVSAKIVSADNRDPEAPLRPGVEGELAIRSPSMLSAYVGEEGAPTCKGFFMTGDLARMDARGAITITGRIKLLIDVGALKVNPIEVETVLCEHDEVRACLVTAAPVSDTVSRIRALIVPRDPAHPPSGESIRRFLRTRLSAHKIPRVIEMVDALPASPTGKVLRRNLAS